MGLQGDAGGKSGTAVLRRQPWRTGHPYGAQYHMRNSDIAAQGYGCGGTAGSEICYCSHLRHCPAVERQQTALVLVALLLRGEADAAMERHRWSRAARA